MISSSGFQINSKFGYGNGVGWWPEPCNSPCQKFAKDQSWKLKWLFQKPSLDIKMPTNLQRIKVKET